MKTTFINNLPVVEIDDFLSSDVTHQLLNERKNSFKSAHSHYPTYYRNNDRLVEDNFVLAKFMFDELQKLDYTILLPFTGVNNRIRFCRYQQKQRFTMHQDGVHYPNDKSESKYTLLLYLNDSDDFVGGNTEFYASKYDKNPSIIIKPIKGKLILFDHRIWHQGTEIKDGNKYILRSDVYVKRQEKSNLHDGYIWSLLNVDENHFVSCGRDTMIKLWNKKLQLLNSFKFHAKSVLKVIQLGENEFVSCSRDFTLKKWSVTGKVLSSIPLGEMILNMVYHTLKKQIIAVGTTGNIYILNADLIILKTIKIHTSWIWGLALIEDLIVTCGEDGAVFLTHLTTGDSHCILKHNEALFSIYANTDTVFVGSKSGTVIKLSLADNHKTYLDIHKDIVRAIIPYKNELITCGEDNCIMRYYLLDGRKTVIRVSDNFIQDILVMDNKVFGAGFDGQIFVDDL